MLWCCDPAVAGQSFSSALRFWNDYVTRTQARILSPGVFTTQGEGM